MPVQEIIDSLSEQNFEQITLARWIELYNSAKQIQKEKENIYLKKTIKREPHNISYKDIKVSLGAPWIDKSIINEFVNYIVFGDAFSGVEFAEYEPVSLRRQFLKEHHKSYYTYLLMTGKITKHLAEIDETCHNVLKDMVSKMAKQEGITEQLKADNKMLWVQKMNSIHSRAEDFIMREYVYGGFAE